MVKICTVNRVPRPSSTHHEDAKQLVLDALLRRILSEIRETDKERLLGISPGHLQYHSGSRKLHRGRTWAICTTVSANIAGRHGRVLH